VAHPVDGLVYARFLFDIGVGAGDIGFGLVIIVVGYEIFHCIVGKEALELAIQLRGEDLVGGEDQRGALGRLDYLGHGEGFARTRHAQQNLRFVLRGNAFDQFGDGGGLVTGGLIVAGDSQRRAGAGFFGPSGAVGGEGAVGVGFVQATADDEFDHGAFMSVLEAFCKACLRAAK